jgi:DNA segregation ATPase FtsK/SpoIIIE, S-DNA-T family
MAKAAPKKTSQKPRSNKEQLEERRKRRNEIIGLFCIGIGVALLFALFTYDRRDPSWGTASARSEVSNLLGPFGANTANMLYQAFGYIALIVPVAFFMLAYWLIRYARIQFSWFKMTGLALVLLSLTGLLAVLDVSKQASFHWGGWVGDLLVYGDGFGLASFLHAVGATIVLLLTLITGLMMATSFSLVGLVMQLSDKEREVGVLAAVNDRIKTWWQNRQLRQQELAAESARARKERESAARAKEEIKIKQPEPRVGEQLAVTEESKKSSFELAVSAQAPLNAQAKNAPPANHSSPALSEDLEGFDEAAEPEEWEDGNDAQSLSQGQRSVLEMVSTVSVKRPEIIEEKPVPPAPLALVKNTLRTAVEYKLPGTDILVPPAPRSEIADDELKERAIQLAEKCREFNVSGQVKQISPGPVVTTFEFKPDPGVKYSRITGLVDDLCLGLKAESIRIDRIPGKSTVGIEVPNIRRETIRLREVIESSKFVESSSKLTLALGKTIDGSNYVADLTKMPHLLIAGATGAGKSVALNSILASLLYKATPDEVKMILVDPKRLELGLYSDIPHLLTPIVTDAKRASYSLRWAVSEMENRYKHLAAFGVRNIDQYNHEVCVTVDHNIAADSDELPKPLPYIVVVIDELADLMMVAARDVEESITRLAQMARAVGIHLVLATQRPSVDVITGLIKANFPSRISFRVSSKVDSRTIIDTNGAEALLGQGDMLFLPPGTSRLVRVHGAYIDEKEVKRICDHARTQGKPAYDEKIVMSDKEVEGEELNGDLKRDEKYEEAVRIVIEMGRASTSVLQRRLRIGYGRAASIIDLMHREGIVGPEDGSKPRQVLVKSDFLERLDQLREEGDPW